MVVNNHFNAIKINDELSLNKWKLCFARIRNNYDDLVGISHSLLFSMRIEICSSKATHCLLCARKTLLWIIGNVLSFSHFQGKLRFCIFSVTLAFSHVQQFSLLHCMCFVTAEFQPDLSFFMTTWKISTKCIMASLVTNSAELFIKVEMQQV